MANSGVISSIYDYVALSGVFLAVYVMQRTEHDKINSAAPAWLQWVRRLSFATMALLLLNSMLAQASRLSLFLLVLSGVGSLAINAVALHLRVPPSGRPNHRRSAPPISPQPISIFRRIWH